MALTPQTPARQRLLSGHRCRGRRGKAMGDGDTFSVLSSGNRSRALAQGSARASDVDLGRRRENDRDLREAGPDAKLRHKLRTIMAHECPGLACPPMNWDSPRHQTRAYATALGGRKFREGAFSSLLVAHAAGELTDHLHRDRIPLVMLILGAASRRLGAPI